MGDLSQGQPLIGRERRWSARGSCIDPLRCDENPCRQIRCVRPLDGTRRVVLMWLAPRWCLRHGAYDHGHLQRAKAEPSIFWDRFCVAGGFEKMWNCTGGSNLSSFANITMRDNEMLAVEGRLMANSRRLALPATDTAVCMSCSARHIRWREAIRQPIALVRGWNRAS